jgi:hypothetical protein
MHVALVASLPDGDESLALAYLSAALRAAGHRPHVVTFRGLQELEEAARRVCALPAPLLGLSIPSGHAAIDLLALLHRVRSLGFAGHVTCGGGYATLARHRLLQSHAGLDSVVRHDGELPIVALADALERRQQPDGIAGLTTRQGDGSAAAVEDCTGLSLLPERAATRLYAGVPSAKVSAVRGCWGGCSYCGLSGLRREALREAGLRGLSCEQARSAGIGAMRRRSVQHVADEMQKLYCERGVRYFHFVDENHLPREPEQACALIDALHQALEQRGVRDRALSLMLRADIATPDVVEALTRLGVVRCLLGVESNTPEGLAALGRGAAPSANQTAAALLHRYGISFHFNVLLLHPQSTLASIQREVAALANIEGGLVDPFQVELLEGTELFSRVKRAGQLLGGPHLWHFWPQDSSARRFAEVFFAVKRQVMGRQQLTAYAYEVLGMLAVAGRLGRLGNALPRLARDAEMHIAAHNRLWQELLQGAVQLAADSAPRSQQALVRDGSVSAAAITLQFASLARAILRAADGPLRTDVHYPRTRTAVAFAACVLASACGGVSSSSPRLAGDASMADGAGEDTGVAGADAGFADATAEAAMDGSAGDALFDAPADTGIEAAAEGSVSCNAGIAQSELDALLQAAAGCPDVCSAALPPLGFEYRFVLDAAGHVLDMERDDGEPIEASLKKCYLDAVAGQVFPCLAQEQVWVPCMIALK